MKTINFFYSTKKGFIYITNIIEDYSIFAILVWSASLDLCFFYYPIVPLICSPYTTFAVYGDANSLYEHLIPEQGG